MIQKAVKTQHSVSLAVVLHSCYVPLTQCVHMLWTEWLWTTASVHMLWTEWLWTTASVQMLWTEWLWTIASVHMLWIEWLWTTASVHTTALTLVFESQSGFTMKCQINSWILQMGKKRQRKSNSIRETHSVRIATARAGKWRRNPRITSTINGTHKTVHTEGNKRRITTLKDPPPKKNTWHGFNNSKNVTAITPQRQPWPYSFIYLMPYSDINIGLIH
jgi:hypothetical protein